MSAESDHSNARPPARQESPAIAISEENLAALIGAPKPASRNGTPDSPTALPPSPPPEPILSRPQPEVVLPLLPTPPVEKADDEPRAAEPGQAIAPVAAPPDVDPPAKRVDSRLALIAAIKQNRSSLRQIEAHKAQPALPSLIETVPNPRIEPMPTANGVSAVTLEHPVPHEAVKPEQFFSVLSAITQVEAASPPPADLPPKPSPVVIESAPPPAAAPIAEPSKPPGFLDKTEPAKVEPAIALEERPADSSVLRARLILGGAAAIIALISGSIYFISHPSSARRPAQPKEAAASQAPIFPLHLVADSPASGLINVHWNPQSVLIEEAREGRVVITEGDRQPRTVPLSVEQLKLGQVSYQTSAARVQFQLEVSDRSGIVATESVQAISAPLPASAGASTLVPVSNAVPPAVASPAVSRTPAPAAQTPSNPAIKKVEETAKTEDPVPAPAAPKSAPRAFQAPLTSRIAIGDPQVLSEPPALSTITALPVNPSSAMPSVKPPSALVPPVPAPAAQFLRVATNLQSAKLIRKVAPVYPPVAKSARIQGTVRFSATVGKDGNITNLQFVSGPSLLVPAAADAVKQWIYRPTLLNGQPVEVLTDIQIDFSLNQ